MVVWSLRGGGIGFFSISFKSMWLVLGILVRLCRQCFWREDIGVRNISQLGLRRLKRRDLLDDTVIGIDLGISFLPSFGWYSNLCVGMHSRTMRLPRCQPGPLLISSPQHYQKQISLKTVQAGFSYLMKSEHCILKSLPHVIHQQSKGCF